MKFTALFVLLLAALPAFAQTQAPAQRQNLAQIPHIVQQYLETQAAGLPGQVKVTVGAVDQRISLAHCPAPEAFQQPGSRPWGKTTVGVRCTAPVPWTIFVQAQVSVMADYVSAAVPLAQGQPIDASQLVLLKGDIAAMPNGIITDINQAVGRSPLVSLSSGTPLRIVRLVSNGANFSVSSEAKSLGTAGEGQIVQVRTSSGSVVSGTARAGGVVQVAF
jgi:flagella basal body P-ring formation protein FlgA